MNTRNGRTGRSAWVLAAGISLVALPAAAAALGAGEPPAAEASKEAPRVPSTRPATQPTTRPAAKAISEQVKKGLDWLAKNQREDGGWDQGEVKKEGIRGGEPDRSNLGDTCMTTLAFVRAGHTPKDGEHAAIVRKGLDFVCGEVEKASQNGLSVTDIRTTRLQTKLGQHIDTFAAALLLAEVREKMPDEASRKRVMAALDKVMDKIEKNQKEDGRWVDANDGWASVLCNGVANKAVFRAAQNGQPVSDAVLSKAQKYAAAQYDLKSGAVSGAGSANVELYARAANLGAFQDAANANQDRERVFYERQAQAKEQVAQAQAELVVLEKTAPATAPAAAAARKKVAEASKEVVAIDGNLNEIRQNVQNLAGAQQQVLGRLDDKGFVAGFGSNGGEEFLSYMNIGESLWLRGGEEWAKFDKEITGNLNRIQNPDGSWSGHHCITGRTFCTAAAVLTLTVDRSPVPVAEKVKEAKGK